MTDATAVAHTSLPRDRRLRLGLSIAKLIKAGTMEVILPDGSVHHFAGTEPGPAATLIVRDARMIAKLVFGGSLGLSEAYLDGDWDSPNLIDVLRLGTLNEAAWEDMLRGKLWARVVSTIAHKLRPNTRKGARRNIAEHYDLGNDFYASWLDETMTYSAALFDRDANSLEVAQRSKIHRLCKALELQPGMSVLEVGCGWGSFAEIAARDYGARVTGITLSREQLEFGQARIAKSGLVDRVSLELRDYRDVSQQFDRIASIEMFEAVGESYWPTYFNCLRDRLRPGGFMLPSPSRLHAEISRAGLHLRDSFWFGPDYADTLARWGKTFQDSWPRITKFSRQYDTRFKRLWEFYLAYCEAGFRAGWTDVGQFVIARP
ncbi:MAG: SAM-dependent methyltransferase [Acidiphilium sp. 34-60-192]|nr:MAG: SAM-dependent methyltransferase [Acidiphilium sp. 34-60-192]